MSEAPPAAYPVQVELFTTTGTTRPGHWGATTIGDFLGVAPKDSPVSAVSRARDARSAGSVTHSLSGVGALTAMSSGRYRH